MNSDNIYVVKIIAIISIGISTYCENYKDTRLYCLQQFIVVIIFEANIGVGIYY